MGDLQPDGLAMVNNVYQLTYKGQTRSFSNWARIRGIPRGVIKERARHRWPVAQILGYEPRVAPQERYDYLRRKLTYDGRTQFVVQWAAETGKKPNVILARIALDWTVGEALGFVPRRRNHRRKNNLREFPGLKVVTKTIELIDRKAMGKQAREIRSKAGKTLREASEALGMTISGLDHLEVGRRKWTAELINRFNAVAAGWVVSDDQTND